jgi:PAS domain S-box-containing protein
MSETPHVQAVVVSDAGGIIRHWNADAERLIGYSATEAEGQSLNLIVPEEYRERQWNAFHAAMRTGVCNADRGTTNIPVRCKDGVVRPLPGRFVFLMDARNHPVGALAIWTTPAGGEQPFGPIVPL